MFIMQVRLLVLLLREGNQEGK